MSDSAPGCVVLLVLCGLIALFFWAGKADGADEARAELTPATAWVLYVEAQDKAEAKLKALQEAEWGTQTTNPSQNTTFKEKKGK